MDTPGENRDGPLILLLEEDRDTRRLLTRALRRVGYRVRTAADDEEARDALSSGERPALLLADYPNASEEAAMEAARSLRRAAGLNGELPIVALADEYRPDLEGTEVNVGGNDFVVYMESFEQLNDLLAWLFGDTSEPLKQ